MSNCRRCGCQEQASKLIVSQCAQIEGLLKAVNAAHDETNELVTLLHSVQEHLPAWERAMARDDSEYGDLVSEHTKALHAFRNRMAGV